MSSLHAPAAPVAAPPVPVRHGSCRLEVLINGQRYKLVRLGPLALGERSWSLTHVDGPRVGVSHVVTRYRSIIACSCEDASNRGSKCKHMRALVALGLLSGRGARNLGRVRYAPTPKGGV
jgi:hypothetical protein